MSHDLEIVNGTASFAYGKRQSPWHMLGTPMEDADLTLEKMLVASRADYDVLVRPVIACNDEGQPLLNPDGTFVYVDNSRATVAQRVTGEHDEEGNSILSYTGLATVGTRYHASQNREVLERALAVVGASAGEAVVDTVGVLGIGERFFASIDLGSLVVETGYGNDEVKRYLNVYTSHDGKVPITYTNTNVRTVCANTVQMALHSATRTFKARHTVSGADFLVKDAQRVLGLSTKWAEAFKAQAEALAAIPVGGNDITKVLDRVFPIEPDATERQVKNRDELIGTVRATINNERNMGQFGRTGWALWNGIVEFLDHERPVKSKEKDLTSAAVERALTSMNEGSAVNLKKETAQAAILALV
jgi:phage/plasmid-like protein (TIGR03299 family)